ncbi:MAG: hypothetical protein LBB91_03730, partial [Clostridiales bacterium]|nr:hypothetical protein [Clostridiales bacterium]
MKLKKSVRKAVALFLTFVMLIGMVPVGPFAPKIAEAQMSTSQKTKANFIDVKTGSWHDLALDDEGRVYTWNNNTTGNDGLLGRPTSTYNGSNDRNIAVQVTDTLEGPMPFITKISSSESNCVILDVDGNIWSWGLSRGGENNIGRSGANDRPGRVILPGNIKAIDISAANGGGRAIGADGSIYVWGTGANALTGSGLALGTGASENLTRPKKLETDESGSALPTNFVSISAGDYYNNQASIALTADNKVYTWALGTSGTGTTDAACGYTRRPRNVPLPIDIGTIKIADAGVGFWLLIDDKGDLYTWGSATSTAGNHMGAGLAASSSHRSVPTKITQVERRVGSNNVVGPAPKFKSASAYAWSMVAVAEDGTVFGNGQNMNTKHGSNASTTGQYFRQIVLSSMSIHQNTPATSFSFPTTIDGRPLEFLYVSEGYQGTSFIDQHGNAYVSTTTSGYSSRATTAEPWVHVRDDVTPLFSSIVSVPDENTKRYDSIRAGITVNLSRPADKVEYAILYPDDTDFYTGSGYANGRTFYSLSFYGIEEPYFLEGSDKRLLVSPNGSEMTSRYYANPSISEDVFRQAYNAKRAKTPSEADELGRSTPQTFTVNERFGDNCIVWLQATSGTQTTRIMLPYDNFYTPVSAYVKGIVGDTGKVLYSPRPIPNDQVSQESYYNNPPYGYGLPLNRDKTALAYNKTTNLPPLGWDVVQPLALTSGWDVPDSESYYRLDPANQMEKQATRDQYGVYHRLNPAKEIILDKYDFYDPWTFDNTRNDENTVTFTYSKNPDKWASATLKFVYEDGTSVPGLTDEFKTLMVPVLPAKLFDFDPYTPPASTDPSDSAVGYYLGPTYTPITYKACTFPDGFNPEVSSSTPVTIYIIYKKGLMKVKESYWQVTGGKITEATATKTAIANNSGAMSIENAFEIGENVSRTGQEITTPLNQVLCGFELWKENSLGILEYVKTVEYVWESLDPYATGAYKKLNAEIEDIDANWEIRWLYYPGIKVPDEFKATVTVNWRGRYADGSAAVLTTPVTVEDLAGTIKVFEEKKGTYFPPMTDPAKWLFASDLGDPSPTAPITLEVGTPKAVNFWYKADSNENDIPDEDEYITVKYRVYGDDKTNLLPDANVKPFLLGEAYYGTPAAVSDYHPVGWCSGVYNTDMDDAEIHLISSLDEYLIINFETDLSPNGQPMTIIYKKAAGAITVNFKAVTWAGTVVDMPPQVLTGLVGDNVSWKVVDPLTGNPLWIFDPVRSTLPVGGEFILSDVPQEYTYYYKENLTFSIITVQGKSTDDKINIEHTLRELPDAPPLNTKADAIPNYKVTGWKLYDEYDVLKGSGTGDLIVVNPAEGSQKVVFTYECLDTTIHVVATDGAGNPLVPPHYMDYFDALLDESYTVRAFYVPVYALTDVLTKTIDPVLDGTNRVEFKYALRDNVVIEFYEVGDPMPIKVMNVPDFPIPRTYTAANLEAELTGAYYKFNAAATAAAGTTVPLTITEVLTEQTYKVYFDKIKVPVVIRQWDEDNDVELGRLYTYFTDPGDWLRAGEMATVATESVLGYTLTESSAKSVYVDPDSTELTPQVVTFKYRKNELGDVHVLFYYNGDESNVLEEFTTKAEVGSTFSVTATNSFPGFKLIEAETTKMIMVEGTNPTIKFAYEDIRKNVTVYTRQDDDKPLQADLLKFAEGDPVVILPPYVAGCMPIGYALDPADIEDIDETEIVAIDSSFTGLDLGAIAADHEVVFIYVDYAGQFVILTVKGISGTSELYSYTTLAVNSDEPIEIEALAQEGYRLVSVTEDPANTDPREITPDRDQEIIFKYVSLATTVKIRMVNAAGVDIIPGFDVPAVTGGVLTYHAPNLPGYYLTDPSSIGKVDPVLAEGASEILFHYAPIVSKITIVAKENDKDGRIIKVVEVSPLGIGEYDYTAPDLAAEFYTPKASPNLVKINWDGTNAASGEAYYTKDLASVKVNKIDSATGLPIEGFATVSGLPKGEAATIDAPILTGWVLIGEKSQTVVADGVNEVTFSYRTLANDEVQVKAIEKGTGKVLQSYVMTGTVNDKVWVKAPGILGWSLASDSPIEVTIGTTKEAVFEYLTNQVTVTVHKIHLSSSNEIGAPEEVKVAKGGDATIFAPHIDGYVVNGDISRTLIGIAANEDIYFFYDTIEEVAIKYLAKITVVGQGDSGEILYTYDKLLPKNSGDLDIYAFNVKGYKLLDPSPVTVDVKDSDEKVVFNYESLATTVKIRMVDDADPAKDVAVPFVVAAQAGTVFTYNAPDVAGYYLASAGTIGSVDPVLAGGVSEIVFKYTKITSKLTIVCKENDTFGPVIKVVEIPAAEYV